MNKIIFFGIIFGFLQFSVEALRNCPRTSEKDSDSDSDTEKCYCSYQQTTECYYTEEIKQPKSISEVQNIVIQANSQNKTVKAVGSLHSTTDIICTEGIPIDMLLINHIFVDKKTMTVTAGGGAKMEKVYETLAKNELTLMIVPTFAGISIAGGIGTGAHGSSLIHPSSLSSFVVKVKIVDGLGLIHEIEDEEELKAFRVHLGMLGIICEVTLSVVPAYKIEVKNTPHNDEILFNGEALKMAQNSDFFQMWWFPSLRMVVTAEGKPINYTTPRNDYTMLIAELRQHGKMIVKNVFEFFQETRSKSGFRTLELFAATSLLMDTKGKQPIYTNDGENFVNPAIGHNYRLMANNCNEKAKSPFPFDFQCVWSDPEALSLDDISVTVDAAKMTEIFQTILDILREVPTYFATQGIFIRFTKPTDAYLAKNQFKENIHIEWVCFRRKNPNRDPKFGIGAYQAISQMLAYKFNGTHHWGKNAAVWFTHNQISRTMDHLDKFLDIMKKYDPNGVFMNKFGERLLGKPGNTPRFEGHCALTGFCFCHDNSDCAQGQVCDSLKNVTTDPQMRLCLDEKRDDSEQSEDFLPYRPGDFDAFLLGIVREMILGPSTTTTTNTPQTTTTTSRTTTTRRSTTRRRTLFPIFL